MTGVDTYMDFLTDYNNDSRVWIYQANRDLTDDEVAAIRQHIDRFTRQWVSHNQDLKATGALLQNRFLVLVVDDTLVGPSGCSIDASVHFIRQLGEAFQVDFFGRRDVAISSDDGVQVVSLDELGELYRTGQVTDRTLVYDNLVKTAGLLRKNWVAPLGETWMKRFV